jgi:hypothetical protein
MADNLRPSSTDVMESGSLNLPEPSGPHRPVMGLLYLYIYTTHFKSADRYHTFNAADTDIGAERAPGSEYRVLKVTYVLTGCC